MDNTQKTSKLETCSCGFAHQQSVRTGKPRSSANKIAAAKADPTPAVTTVTKQHRRRNRRAPGPIRQSPWATWTSWGWSGEMSPDSTSGDVATSGMQSGKASIASKTSDLSTPHGQSYPNQTKKNIHKCPMPSTHNHSQFPMLGVCVTQLLAASFLIVRSGHAFIPEFHIDGLFQAILASGFVWMGQTHEYYDS